MTSDPVISALALPMEARVEQRVPKKLLVENGAPTAADKRQINEGIEEILWQAALKPANLGILIFRDAVREYLEVAVLTAHFRSTAKTARLVELIHRAIPYTVLLISLSGEAVSLSVAHKRWSQGEAGKVVIEELRTTSPFCPDAPAVEEAQFITACLLSVCRKATCSPFTKVGSIPFECWRPRRSPGYFACQQRAIHPFCVTS